jgi:hypothetical protein
MRRLEYQNLPYAPYPTQTRYCALLTPLYYHLNAFRITLTDQSEPPVPEPSGLRFTGNTFPLII